MNKMNKWCVIAAVAVSVFTASAQAEVIVRFIVEVDEAARSFDVFIEDLAPVIATPGSMGNGGIGGFTFSIDQGFLDPDIKDTFLIETLVLARVAGLTTGSQGSGFNVNIGEDTIEERVAELSGVHFNSVPVYEFGQTPGQIPNFDFPEIDPNFDGPIPFDRPAFIGHGTYSGTLPLDNMGKPTFPMQAIGASVFDFVGAPVDGDGLSNVASDQLELVVLVPEPASLAMLAAGVGLVFSGRKRETR